jgi:hypothetical protein
MNTYVNYFFVSGSIAYLITSLIQVSQQKLDTSLCILITGNLCYFIGSLLSIIDTKSKSIVKNKEEITSLV